MILPGWIEAFLWGLVVGSGLMMGVLDKLFCEFATSLNCSYIGEVAERMAVVLN